MTVYADEVFFLNGMLDLLLLSTAELLSGAPQRLSRKLAAASFGGLYAVFAAGFPQFGGFLWSALAFCMLCVLAYGIQKVSLRRALLFLLVSSGFGGLVLMVAVLCRFPVHLREALPYYDIDLHLLCLLAGGLYAAVYLALRCFCRHMGALVRVDFVLHGRRTEVTALCDTGNTLADPITAEPVIIADLQTAQKLLPQLDITPQRLCQPAEFLQTLQRVYPDTKPRLLPFRTVGESGMLAAIRCDGIFINGKKVNDRLVAFSAAAFSGEEPYQALTGGNYASVSSKMAAPASGGPAREIRVLHRRQRRFAATAHSGRGAEFAAKAGTGR